mgnify:CR=1 FL=1
MAARKKKKKSKSNGAGGSAPKLPALVDVNALRGALSEGRVPLLVDVRTGMEFGGGHVEGAVNIPLSELPSADLSSNEVWVICRTGNRSASAAQLLRGRGVRVVDVGGGTAAWSRAGYPLVGRSATAALMMPAMASLTLGLAPFFPEPHLVGKLRWVAGGAVGMGAMDWFDLVMHGAPWVWLAVTALSLLRSR